MAKRKSKLPPHISAGTVKRNGKERRDTFAPITDSVLLSDAFQDLKSSEQLLYVFMNVSLHGNRQPAQDITEELPLSFSKILRADTTFYFPKSLAIQYSSRYKDSGKRLTGDIRALEEHGFIRIIESGKSRKTKSIYQFSEEWKNWRPPEKVPP